MITGLGTAIAQTPPATPNPPANAPIYADKPGANLPTEEIVDDPATEEIEKKAKPKTSPGPLTPTITPQVKPYAGTLGEKPITDGAYLQALDKVTARVTRLELALNVPVQFGSLRIVARACAMRPPEEPPESSVFLEIDDLRGAKPAAGTSGGPIAGVRVFSGWMFASSPALSGLQHAVYDVWVTSCRTVAAPANPSTGPKR
jgi:hypothetical protein